MPDHLTPDAIRLVPLGGLGEIGMNCLAVEQRDGIVVVDCGIGFPFDDHGVDVIHPDFTWLLERASDVHGIFLTHGHEDHIGGLPYLLRDLDVPLWGPPHALGLVKRRLDEHDFGDDDVPMRVAEPRNQYDVGPFRIEPVRVTHSIVEASALAIRTPAGTVVHTGDFKFDPTPPDGEPTDERRLRELGDEGVALLLSDSTNIDAQSPSRSEKTVGDALDRIISEADGRVVVAMFASNIQRLRLLGDIATRTKRKICLLGRSLRSQHEIATRIGRLDWPSSLCVSPQRAAELPRNQVLILAGGTQGEPQSSFRRLASGEHTALAIETGDTAILSSRIIPGNDRPVFAMMGDLLRRGIHMRTWISDPEVHASGHATRPEQTKMIELVRPRSFLPVHGTLHHMHRHADLARTLGIEDVLVVENGTAVRFDGALTVDGPVPHGKVPVAQGGEDLDAESLAHRVDLGRGGVVLISLALEGQRIVDGPKVTSLGVPAVDDEPSALRAIAADVASTIERLAKHGSRNLDLSDEVRRAARRRVEKLSGVRAVVEVHLLGDG